MADSTIEKYAALFAGRADAYAFGGPDENQPWKYRYTKDDRPLTHEVLAAHLDGARTIGMYCEREGLAKWFALDCDAPKDADTGLPIDGGFDVALAEAKRIQDTLLRVGLFTYLERSRSGNGVHCWGFLDGWVDARKLAYTLLAIIPADLVTVDRGKRYPPLKESKNSILICLPYAGEAVEAGNAMFLDAEGAELPLDAFLDTVRVNPIAVLDRIDVPRDVPGMPRQYATLQATDFSGRPAKLGTGVLKMLSPFGCNFTRQVWLQQHNAKVVGEPEWYAVLGQLSAFKNGREAAHAMFCEHKFYEPRGMDEKFDHAAQNPPVGCGYIRDNFKQFECKGCPLTAPYRKGYQSMRELCGENSSELERALYDKDLERIRRLDASDEPEGIASGIPGVDHLLRYVPGDFVAIGAQPSIGKTALAVHMTNTIAATGVDVALFSAESGPVSFHDRQLAHRAGVDSYALKGLRMANGQKQRLSMHEWAAIEEAAAQLKQLPIWENYTTSNPQRIYDSLETMLLTRRDALDRVKSLLKPAIALYDYFQYAQAAENAREEPENVRLSRQSYEQKCITKIIEQPFVTFAQLIRESEGVEKPKLNWYRGTARLEHDMDAGVIITGTRMPGRFAPRTIHSVKRREGVVGWTKDLLLEQATSRFVDQASMSADQRPNELHNPPWEGARQQLTLVKPND